MVLDEKAGGWRPAGRPACWPSPQRRSCPPRQRQRPAARPSAPAPSTGRPSPRPARGQSTTTRRRRSPKQTLVVTGDAGPASGSQTVRRRAPGSITILVIGGITYLKGNAGGLQNLAGLSASQADGRRGPVDRVLHRQRRVRPGRRRCPLERRRHRAAAQGPALPRAPAHARRHSVDAIEGTQTFARKSRARRALRPRSGVPCPGGGGLPQREGADTATEHVTYSKWGELVRPLAPQATVSIGPVSAV